MMMSLNGKSAPKANPTLEDMVRALCTFQEKIILDGNKEKQFLECPNGNFCKNANALIISPSNMGWTNLFQHLVMYMGKGSIETLNESYESFLSKNKLKQTSMPDHAFFPQPLSTKYKETYLFVMMIVLERWPLSSVEKANDRNTLNIENPFSTQLLIKVLLQMTVDIEGLISAEMNSAPGGRIIMHDGWSKILEHYSELFALFNRKVKKNIRRVASGMLKETTETKETLEPNIVLLSVSPLHNIVE